MGLFLSEGDVRKVVRRELETFEQRLNRRLTELTELIMATQAEVTAMIAEKTAQIRKAIDEVTTKLAMLEDAVKNSPATPELIAAVQALGIAVQAADDIVPDAPPPQP